MNNSSNNIIRNSGGNDTLTLASGATIRGAGTLIGNFGGMVNNGTIIADQATKLVIDTDTEGFAQAGTLRATGTGGLHILNTPFTNTNGIDIEAGSNLLVEGSTIVGGAINIDPTALATFITSSNLDAVTINGDVTHNNNQTVDIFNGLTLNGTWNMNGAGNTTNLLFHGNHTLTGSGTVNLSNNASNTLRPNGGNDTLTIDTDVTIQGAGTLVANFGGMVNNGTIIADQATKLVIDTDVEGFTQNGTLRATGTGGLHILNTPFTNTNGIDIEAESNLLVEGSTIVGGAINIDPTASATFITSSNLDAVTINGDVTHNNNQTVDIFNGLTLNGTWNMNGGANSTNLLVHGDQSILGSGEILMSNSANNILRPNGGNDTLTIGADITVRGAGTLVANFGGLINNGTIIADQTTKLVIDTDVEGFAQTGILRATGAGGLHILNTPFTNTNGIDIEAGSNLLVEGSTIFGGEINIDPTASATFITSSNLDAVTINGDVTHNNNQTVDIFNGLTLNGTWNINGGANSTNLLVHGDQSILGSGEILMSNSANNVLRPNGGNDTLTIGADITVKGAGTLVANFGGLINNGTIIADQATKLVIDTDVEGFAQTGILRATGTGGLHILNTLFTNTNDIDIEAGSNLLVEGSTIFGGEINIDPTASATFITSSNLDAVTINGDVTHNNNQTVDIFNGLTLNGTWNMNGAGNDTNLLIHGNQSILGNGEIVMSNNLSNVLRPNGGNDILTIGENITVRGAGTLVKNFGGMVNNGTIIADQTTKILIDTDTEGFNQNGILRATGSGGLHILNTPFTNTNGIDIEANSNLLVQGSTIFGGEINIDSTASATFVTSSNLNAVTINGDVTHNNNQTVDIFSGLTLNGTWNMNGAGNTTNLLFHGDQTLTGSGTVKLSNNGSNTLRPNGGNDILTVDTGITIEGSGNLIANFGGLINKGTITANQDTRLIIDADTEGFENQGQVTVTGLQGLRSVGSFTQTAGTTTVSSTLEFTQNGQLNLAGGILEGSGIILGDVNNTGGTVNAGNSPGELTINENYTQTTNGTLLIEIAGTSSGQFDVLQVNGDATLGGTIAVELLGSPAFGIGQTFDVLFATEIIGSFLNDIVTAGAASFAVSIIDGFDQDIVRLTATSAVPLPPAAWMLLSGFAFLLQRRKRTIRN